MIGLNREQQTNPGGPRRSNPAVGFGTSFAVGMVLFALVGRWLDGKYEKEHLFTLLGIGVGFLYGAWELYKMIAISKEREQQGLEEPADDESPK